MEKKICIKCELEKDITDFYKGKNQCKSCKILYQKELTKNKIIENSNLERRECSNCNEEKDILFFNKYGSKCKECESIYYQKNKDVISERKKKYNLDNKEKNKIRWSNYYEKNKDIVLEKGRNRYDYEYKRQYYLDNKEHLREKRIERYKYRIKSDDIYRLRLSLKNMIRSSFIRQYTNKSKRTIEILGCSFEEFKLYLESKFEPWMTWENRGLYNGEFNYGWDIDHIIPLSSAETEEDIIRLNHYTNLQPLCSKINRDIKKNKWK